jgi:hypothetical protein
MAKEICTLCAAIWEACGNECGQHQRIIAGSVPKCVWLVQQPAGKWLPDESKHENSLVKLLCFDARSKE